MTRPSSVKKQQKLRLAQNISTSKKVVKNVTKKTRQLPDDVIPDIDRPTDNEHFTYKKRPFAGPSHKKLSNFLEKQNTDFNEDTNDYYQIIHNSFLLELMKQSICISCKSIWSGNMSVAKREGTVCVVLS